MMNEQIYAIAAEAAEHALLNPSEDALQSEAEGYDTITVPRQFIDKFAELIVRECTAQLMNKQDFTWQQNYLAGWHDAALAVEKTSVI